MSNLKLCFKTIHLIDYDKEEIILKEITQDLSKFIVELSDHTNTSEKSQTFSVKDDSTQVINLTYTTIKGIISHDEKLNDLCLANATSIANRLLDKEIEAQAQIDRTGFKVKKGSLLQAVLYDETDNKYLYLLTKIEHKDFFEDDTFYLKTGFSVDKNKFFKSCLISYVQDEEKNVNIQTIRVFLDNKANYWHDAFLEITPIRQDDKNTNRLFEAVDYELKKIVNKKSRYDYLVYRNHLLGYVKSQERIDYEELMKQVFVNSVPDNIDEKTKINLIDTLNVLPEKKGFDRQFNCVPKAIKARTINKSFQLNTGVELVIKDYMPDEMRCISVEHVADGTTYLRVQTDNAEVMETFPELNRE